MTTPGLQFLVAVVAGWVNRNQQEVIEYLQAENRVLRERLGGRRVRFTDAQCRRLAVAAKRVGRKGLFAIETVVTLDTLPRWYRNLVAQKYDGSRRRGVARPRTAAEIERLIVTMASENPGWGYTRIQVRCTTSATRSGAAQSSEYSSQTASTLRQSDGGGCRGRRS